MLGGDNPFFRARQHILFRAASASKSGCPGLGNKHFLRLLGTDRGGLSAASLTVTATKVKEEQCFPRGST